MIWQDWGGSRGQTRGLTRVSTGVIPQSLGDDARRVLDPCMPRLIPLNFFGIPFGLLGLADSWLVSASFGLAPVAIGRVMVAIAVLAWVVVGSAHLHGIAGSSGRVTFGAELTDPVAGPFVSLVVLTPMLAAADALFPYSHTAGAVVVDIGVAWTIVLAGWFTGQWIYGRLELANVHPGYFLPSVAGGFVASASAALVGQTHLAEILFGLGVISWIVIGSIVLGRLFLGPPLATPLIPTIAIEVAPAAVATFAAFAIDGHRVDTLVRVLAGYGVLMVVAQVRLLPTFLKLKFMPSFWAFTFAWAAVAFAGLFWLGVTHPTGWRTESYVALALITAFVGAIAARTVVALYRGQLIPAHVPAPTAHTTTPDIPRPERLLGVADRGALSTSGASDD
jgi:tellurite resistance protein